MQTSPWPAWQFLLPWWEEGWEGKSSHGRCMVPTFSRPSFWAKDRRQCFLGSTDLLFSGSPLLMLYGFLAQPFSLSTGRLVFKIFVQKYHFKLKAGYFVLGGVDLFPQGSRCDKIPEDDG